MVLTESAKILKEHGEAVLKGDFSIFDKFNIEFDRFAQERLKEAKSKSLRPLPPDFWKKT